MITIRDITQREVPSDASILSWVGEKFEEGIDELIRVHFRWALVQSARRVSSISEFNVEPIDFGIIPLRSVMCHDGKTAFIDPVVTTACGDGVEATVNPAWEEAPFETVVALVSGSMPAALVWRGDNRISVNVEKTDAVFIREERRRDISA